MTYAYLALAVIAVPVALDLVFCTKALRDPRAWAAFLVLLGFTLVFNSILTGVPIVTYDAGTLLGVYVGTIPIEDFSYTFAAAFLPRVIIALHERR